MPAGSVGPQTKPGASVEKWGPRNHRSFAAAFRNLGRGCRVSGFSEEVSTAGPPIWPLMYRVGDSVHTKTSVSSHRTDRQGRIDVRPRTQLVINRAPYG